MGVGFGVRWWTTTKKRHITSMNLDQNPSTENFRNSTSFLLIIHVISSTTFGLLFLVIRGHGVGWEWGLGWGGSKLLLWIGILRWWIFIKSRQKSISNFAIIFIYDTFHLVNNWSKDAIIMNYCIRIYLSELLCLQILGWDAVLNFHKVLLH